MYLEYYYLLFLTISITLFIYFKYKYINLDKESKIKDKVKIEKNKDKIDYKSQIEYIQLLDNLNEEQSIYKNYKYLLIIFTIIILLFLKNGEELYLFNIKLGFFVTLTYSLVIGLLIIKILNFYIKDKP